jgi:hypothetical protein
LLVEPISVDDVNPRRTRGADVNSWEPYFEAAHRKRAIAEYYLSRLAEILTPPDGLARQPPIPVQAYFEGVIVSAMAAVDQVAQGINSALGLRLNPNTLVNGAFTKLTSFLPALQEWYENPLGIDLRRIRTRIIHYSYSKSPDLVCLRW